MRWPTSLFVAAVIVLETGAPGGAFGGVSSGPLVLLDQERTLSTMVIVPPCEAPNSEFANDAALNFEPFESLIEAIRSCKNATGVAIAQQTSSFNVIGMTATGATHASASSQVNSVIHAIPASHVEATFEVDAAHSFVVTGVLSAAGQAPVVLAQAQVRLTNAQSQVVFEFAAEPGANGDETIVPVDGTGELAPGVYTLRIDAVAVIDSTVPPGGDGSATFDIEFRIVIPGDINLDGAINGDDAAAFCAAIGSSEGDPQFVDTADLNDDGVIDQLDQQLFSEIVPPCAGDIVDSATFAPPPDGETNGADLAFLLGAWGDQPSCADMVSSKTFAPPPDGIVDGADLAYLLGAWGDCP